MLWVNIRVLDLGSYGKTHYANYGLPDPRVTSSFPRVKIRTIQAKTFPQWKWKDFSLGIISRLELDSSLKKPITEGGKDLEVTAYPEHGCWILSTKAKVSPSRELWDCYQAISRHLLATAIPPASS